MTAGDIPVLDVSYPAYASMTSYQFSAVYIDATAATARLCGTSNAMMGILQDKPDAAGVTCVVRELGHSKVRILTGCTQGDPLKVGDAYGRLTTGTLGSDVIVAIALETATGTDQIIEAALTARTAQGTTYRSGHLTFLIPIKSLYCSGATAYVYEAMPLGFAGAVVDMFAVVNSTCAATTSATAALTVHLGAAGHTAVTGLSIPVGNLTEAAVEAIGTVIAGTGTAAVNTFAATDKISILATKGSTGFGNSDTGTIELHVVTN